MKRLRGLAVLLLVGGLVIALGVGGGLLALSPERTIYVVVHGGIADPFWKVVEKGVRDAAASPTCSGIDVIYTGPEVFSLEEFLADIDAALAALNPETDGLVCTLTAPEAMDEPLRAAIAEGLPIIAINAPDLREPPETRIPVLTYIGEDSYFIGVTAARETLKRFTPKRAAFLNHHPGARHIYLRGKGYCDVMKEQGIFCEQVDITEDPIKGAEITVAYLKANPDTDAIFSSNTLRTETIIPRLEDEGYEVGVDVKIAQMDMSPKVLDYILEGKIMFTMDQQQYLQGFWGTEFMCLHLKYAFTPPPPPVSTGPAVITAEVIPMLEELVAEGYR